MPHFHQFRESLSEAWDAVVDGWRQLYRRAAGAMTRFTPSSTGKSDLLPRDAEEIAVRSTGWGMLASEVFDDDERIVMRMEAPGMDKDDFEISVANGYLLVRGRKQMERERTQGRYHVVECAYGRFERAVPLPDEVEFDKAKATYKRGVLRVELPKSHARRARTIRVKVR